MAKKPEKSAKITQIGLKDGESGHEFLMSPIQFFNDLRK